MTKPSTRSLPTARWGALGAVLLAGAGLSGCVANLEAVRTFAKTSAATVDYQQVVNDYVESPNRQKAYQPASQYGALDRLAAARQQQRAALESAQKILADYLRVLGDVAADDLPNVDANLDNLSGALTDARLAGNNAPLSQRTATAAGALAKVVLRVGADRWRQHKIRQLVAETDPSVQAVVAGLRDLVGHEFRASLRTDSLAVVLFFNNVAAYGPNNPGLGQLARLVERDHREAVQNRLAKARAYGKVLTAIGAGHHDLLLHLGHLTQAQVRARLAQHVQDLQALYRSFTELKS